MLRSQQEIYHGRRAICVKRTDGNTPPPLQSSSGAGQGGSRGSAGRHSRTRAASPLEQSRSRPSEKVIVARSRPATVAPWCRCPQSVSPAQLGTSPRTPDHTGAPARVEPALAAAGQRPADEEGVAERGVPGGGRARADRGGRGREERRRCGRDVNG